MKRTLLLIATALLLGGGCASRMQSANSPFPAPAPWPRTGAALVREAVSQTGPEVMATDAQTGRRFTSQLPATFTDGNGSYTDTNGGKVDVQVAIGGTPEEDVKLFTAIKGITNIEQQQLGNWHVITAFDTNGNRWVARASQADSVDWEHMYHVIECLPTDKGDAAFWDGCRTIIEHAMVGQATAGSGSSPTP